MQGQLQEVGRIQAKLIAVGNLQAILSDTSHMSGVLAETGRIGCSLTEAETLIAELTLPKGKASPPFTGAYTYTPTQETQTIPINGLKAIQDITIEPIPSNYGLITWNGSTITVS